MLPAALTLGALSAVLRLLDDPGAVEVALSAVQTGSWLVALLGLWWRPPALFLEASGFCVRRLLARGRLVPWDDVDRVVVQGRCPTPGRLPQAHDRRPTCRRAAGGESPPRVRCR